MPIDLLIVQDRDGLLAHHGDLAQLSVAIAIFVDPQVALGRPDLPTRRVGPFGGSNGERLVLRQALRSTLRVLWSVIGRQILNDLAVVAQSDQIRDRHLLAVSGKGGAVVQLDGAPCDQKLLRRHQVDLDLPHGNPLSRGEVVEHLGNLLPALLISSHQRLFALFKRDRLDFPILQDQHHAFLGQPTIGVDLGLEALFVVDLRDAILLEQGILEPVMENLEATLLVPEDLVDVRGRLLGTRFLIL